MALSTRGLGIYIKVPARRWNDERFRSLSADAQLAWYHLTAYSKDQETDGLVTARAVRLCDIAESAVRELVAADYLATEAAGWRLTDYAEWQVLRAEQAQIRDQRSRAGRASVAARSTKDLARAVHEEWPSGHAAPTDPEIAAAITHSGETDPDALSGWIIAHRAAA